MISVTSSTTPLIVENSWSAPLRRTAEIAKPSKEERRNKTNEKLLKKEKEKKRKKERKKDREKKKRQKIETSKIWRVVFPLNFFVRNEMSDHDVFSRTRQV